MRVIKSEKPCIVIGSSGHAGVVLDAMQAGGIQSVGIIDPSQVPGSTILGIQVIGGDNLLEDADFVRSHTFAVGIGNQSVKRKIALSIFQRGGTLKTVIHPRAFLASNVFIGEGTFIAAGAIVATGARVGRFAILNTGCSVDHDGDLSDGVQICPGARLAGNVRCGENVFVGTNATVLPQISIGDYAVVGAGAVVLRDVPSNVMVAGNPAIVKRVIG